MFIVSFKFYELSVTQMSSKLKLIMNYITVIMNCLFKFFLSKSFFQMKFLDSPVFKQAFEGAENIKDENKVREFVLRTFP